MLDLILKRAVVLNLYAMAYTCAHACKKQPSGLAVKNSFLWKASPLTCTPNIAQKGCGFRECRAALKGGSIPLGFHGLLCDIINTVKLILDIFERSDFCLRLLNVQSAGVV